MATMRDVANKAGVSITTVSHVINKTRPVSEKLRTRVTLAMRELGYRPNRLARGLRRGETHTLGLIVPDIADPFFGEMARCIEDAGFDRGYGVLLCNSDQRLDKELAYARSLIEAQVDGILFVASSSSAEAVELILQHGIAAVLVDRELPGVMVDRILIDNVAGGRMATERLLQLGHRRIACIGAPSERLPFGGRVRGFQLAMDAAGVVVDESLVVRSTLAGSGRCEDIQFLLSRADPPTAVFACNDQCALDVLEAAVAAGMQVPSDLSIIGFDGIHVASMSRPPLTTLAQPRKKIGQLAVRMLLERIRDPSLPPRTEVLAPQLVIRESTAQVKVCRNPAAPLTRT